MIKRRVFLPGNTTAGWSLTAPKRGGASRGDFRPHPPAGRFSGPRSLPAHIFLDGPKPRYNGEIVRSPRPIPSGPRIVDAP